jgi:hypothetical protein
MVSTNTYTTTTASQASVAEVVECATAFDQMAVASHHTCRKIMEAGETMDTTLVTFGEFIYATSNLNQVLVSRTRVASYQDVTIRTKRTTRKAPPS